MYLIICNFSLNFKLNFSNSLYCIEMQRNADLSRLFVHNYIVYEIPCEE